MFKREIPHHILPRKAAIGAVSHVEIGYFSFFFGFAVVRRAIAKFLCMRLKTNTIMQTPNFKVNTSTLKFALLSELLPDLQWVRARRLGNGQLVLDVKTPEQFITVWPRYYTEDIRPGRYQDAEVSWGTFTSPETGEVKVGSPKWEGLFLANGEEIFAEGDPIPYEG